jgi:hypothetical protein
MKTGKVVVWVMLVVLLGSLNSFGTTPVVDPHPPVNVTATADADALAQNNVDIKGGGGGEVKVRIPSDLLDVPQMMEPAKEDVESWAESDDIVDKENWTTLELADYATTRFCGILWHEWRKNYKIDIACYTKGKAVKDVKIINAKDIATNAIDMNLYEKVGKGKVEAKNFLKDTDQAACALAHKAAQSGVSLIIVTKFATPVATGETAVIGGGGVTAKGDIINMAGGFGTASSENVMKAKCFATLYRLK